ncbi:hypothetical protein GALMADRAFT_141437 [Galerina marginata CBS 339.88]|uniref:Uncharacterized protein n=1 Tax=Galerina marginata (strain CBS 339.88) TaxID=685588 RepID=A0A067T5W1_GALM3|nr:hypothetical protein GALMADRAFT_141437 [Galerina marginata CBS 339.88]
MPLHIWSEPPQPRPFRNGSIGKRIHRSVPSTPIKDVEHIYYRFSPFDLLPVELQVEIFSYCLPPFPHFDIDEAPLLISRVCRAWRSVVLNTPKLWSAFEIEVTGSGTSPSPRDLQIMTTMKLWLERSKNYPLSVRVIHVPINRVPDHRSTQLLAVLIPEARRWRHVQFVVPSTSISSLQHSFPADFPLLQSLTLQMKGLWGSNPSFDVSTMNIPWRQLTSLDLQLEHTVLLTLDKCLVILAQTEQLTRCTMNVDCTLDPRTVHTSHLSLPSLETLHLILQGGTNATTIAAADRPEACLVQFLNILSLPVLQTLRLGWLVQPSGARSWSAKHSDFLAFLHRQAQTIQVLSLAYLPLTERELLECLSRVPNLTHLDLKFSLSDIENDPITESLLTAFTSSPEVTKKGKALLPLMEYFNLQCSGKHYDSAVLLAFIDSRRKLGRGQSDSVRGSLLKSFNLLSMNPVFREVEKHVQKWTQEGMDVRIESLCIR